MEVASELWEQASRGSDFIDVNSICQTINDGISILQVKLDEINGTSQHIQTRSGSFRRKKWGFTTQVARTKESYQK